MWRFESTCGHTVEGWISNVDAHLQAVHQPGEIFEWQMINPATDTVVDTFMWPLS